MSKAEYEYKCALIAYNTGIISLEELDKVVEALFLELLEDL